MYGTSSSVDSVLRLFSVYLTRDAKRVGPSAEKPFYPDCLPVSSTMDATCRGVDTLSSPDRHSLNVV